MAKYREVADDLRTKIRAGVYPVGSKLPPIIDLQEHYGASLGTIRAAQQLLAEERMIETQQGIGAFVASASSARELDVPATIARARDSLTAALAALQSQAIRRFTVDLDAEEYAHWALTDALEDWAHRLRGEIADDPDHPNASTRAEWAECADRLIAQLERIA